MPGHHLRHHEIAGTMENECAERRSLSFGLQSIRTAVAMGDLLLSLTC